MNQRTDSAERAPATPDEGAVETSRGRRPYDTPRVTYREVMESLAAVCSPSPPAKGNPGSCPTGPISS